MDRESALKKLVDGDLKILFSVDLFNEGTDIPNLDLVMFLRPTESAVVYLQQLGRGLRKAFGERLSDGSGLYRKLQNCVLCVHRLSA